MICCFKKFYKYTDRYSYLYMLFAEYDKMLLFVINAFY